MSSLPGYRIGTLRRFYLLLFLLILSQAPNTPASAHTEDLLRHFQKIEPSNYLHQIVDLSRNKIQFEQNYSVKDHPALTSLHSFAAEFKKSKVGEHYNRLFFKFYYVPVFRKQSKFLHEEALLTSPYNHLDDEIELPWGYLRELSAPGQELPDLEVVYLVSDSQLILDVFSIGSKSSLRARPLNPVDMQISFQHCFMPAYRDHYSSLRDQKFSASRTLSDDNLKCIPERLRQSFQFFLLNGIKPGTQVWRFEASLWDCHRRIAPLIGRLYANLASRIADKSAGKHTDASDWSDEIRSAEKAMGQFRKKDQGKDNCRLFFS